jgi:predicted hydrocarbon binding protein
MIAQLRGGCQSGLSRPRTVRLSTVHGLVFSAFRRFTASELPQADERIWHGAPSYSPDDAYADEDFEMLLVRTADESGLLREEVLRSFGRYTARFVFCELRPEFYAASETTRQFLLDVETRIHRTLNETIRGAAPPRLHVVAFGADGVSITYTSDRGLCELLVGLVEGTAAFYGESFEIDHPICMHRGDEACAFFVTPAPAAP